jgi:hypothetical protein
MCFTTQQGGGIRVCLDDMRSFRMGSHRVPEQVNHYPVSKLQHRVIVDVCLHVDNDVNE